MGNATIMSIYFLSKFFMMDSGLFTGQMWFFWMHLHFIFVLMALSGFILLIFWGVKHLKSKQLQWLVTWLLTIGLVGLLVTAPFAPKMKWHSMGGMNMRGADMVKMIEGMDAESKEDMLESMRMMMGR